MKLNDNRIKMAINAGKTVMLKSGLITICIDKATYDDVIKTIGDGKDWRLVLIYES